MFAIHHFTAAGVASETEHAHDEEVSRDHERVLHTPHTRDVASEIHFRKERDAQTDTTE